MSFRSKSVFEILKKGCFATVAAMLVAGGTIGNLYAHPGDEINVPKDFLTGGGWIERPSGEKANFGVGGGVKNGAWWGHLNYKDHGNGLHVKDTSITAYYQSVDDDTESQNGQPTGGRDICGTARTNLYGDVDFHLRAVDNGEPGRNDVFMLRLGKSGTIVYTTEGDPDHTLGGPGDGGGNIQLHRGNRSNTAPATPPECNI